MHQLRSCDFCGGDAAGTFEIVPPELEPTEAEQRRVVLCGECKARLGALLEPLLARAGADVDAGSAAASRDESDTADASSRSERTADSADSVPGSGDDIDRPGAESGTGSGISSSGITVEPGDSTTVDADDRVSRGTSDTTNDHNRRRASDLEMNAAGGEADAGRDAETDGDAEGEDEDEDGDGDESAATPASETDTSTAGSSESRSETSGDDRTRAQSPSGSVSGSDSRAESGPNSRATSRSDSPSHSAPAAETEGPPRAYSKVVRLLRNREFPMDRSAVESLAAGAYELENHEVEAIVDHAIERGEFRADGEKLHRP